MYIRILIVLIVISGATWIPFVIGLIADRFFDYRSPRMSGGMYGLSVVGPDGIYMTGTKLLWAGISTCCLLYVIFWIVGSFITLSPIFGMMPGGFIGLIAFFIVVFCIIELSSLIEGNAKYYKPTDSEATCETK